MPRTSWRSNHAIQDCADTRLWWFQIHLVHPHHNVGVFKIWGDYKGVSRHSTVDVSFWSPTALYGSYYLVY